MGAKRPDIDWPEVRAFYMTGQLSNRELARRFGISHIAIQARAKKEGWVKDLSQRVATGIKQAVITASLPMGPSRVNGKQREAKEAAVVAAAIEDGKQVVLKHQGLGKILTKNSQAIAEIIEEQIAEVRRLLNAPPPEGLKPAEELRLYESLTKRLTELSRAHDALARAAINSVQIERQSRGLDDMPADPNAPPSISITYYRSDLVLTKVENKPDR